MSEIFISYIPEDKRRARQLAEVLDEFGWSVWWESAIADDEHFDAQIQSALKKAHCIVVLWSPGAVGNATILEQAQLGLKKKNLVSLVYDDVHNQQTLPISEYTNL